MKEKDHKAQKFKTRELSAAQIQSLEVTQSDIEELAQEELEQISGGRKANILWRNQ